MAKELTSSSILALPILDTGTRSTTSNHIVDNAAVIGTSGKVVGYRIYSPMTTSSNGTVNFHCYAESFTGTLTLKCSIYNVLTSTSVTRPDTASLVAHADSTVAVSAEGWASFTFSNISLTQGTGYWILVYSTDASAGTKQCHVLVRASLDDYNGKANLNNPSIVTYYSSDGFSTNGTLLNGTTTSPVVVKFTDGSVVSIIGMPFVGAGVSASTDSLDRGVSFLCPFDCKLIGINRRGFVVSQMDEFKIINGGAAGAGTTQLFQKNTDYFDESQNGQLLFFEPISLTANNYYYILAGFASNSGTGTYYGMGAGSIPQDVQDANTFNFGWVQNNTWAVTQADAICDMGFIIDDITVSSGSGIVGFSSKNLGIGII